MTNDELFAAITQQRLRTADTLDRPHVDAPSLVRFGFKEKVRRRPVVVELLGGGRALLGEGLRARLASPGVLQFAFTLHDHGLGRGQIALAHPDLRLDAGHRMERLLLLGKRLVALGIEHFGLHVRQHLTGGDEVALLHQDIGQPAGVFGGHVDLGGLDAAIAADQACVPTVGAEPVPGSPGGHGDEDARQGK